MVTDIKTIKENLIPGGGDYMGGVRKKASADTFKKWYLNLN